MIFYSISKRLLLLSLLLIKPNSNTYLVRDSLSRIEELKSAYRISDSPEIHPGISTEDLTFLFLRFLQFVLDFIILSIQNKKSIFTEYFL